MALSGAQQPGTPSGPGPIPLPQDTQGTPKPVTPAPTTPAPTTPTATGAVPTMNTAPTQNQNLGTNSLPWLQPWQGGYQAPMSGQQNQALQGISDFTNNNFGLGNSQNYLNSLMSGNYLNPMENPGFQQIQQGATQLANTQNARALQQLQSSAAAGGNALSGGLMQQESDYMRNSNAALQQMMGQLEANQYSQERGYQQQAPALQNMLANTQLGGLSQLMSMGGVPQQLGSQEMQGQYQDWLRQIGQLQGQYQYPDQMANALLGKGYPASYQQQYGQSPASGITDLLSQLFGQNSATGSSGIDWNSILSSLGITGGSGSTGGTATDTGTQGSGTQMDAHSYHFDSVPGLPTGSSSPSSYGDTQWYQNQLGNEVARGNQPIANPYMTQYAGLNTGLGIAGILLPLLKALTGGGQKPQSNKAAMGGGLGGPGGMNSNKSAGNAGDFQSGANNPNNPFGTNPAFNTAPTAGDSSQFAGVNGTVDPFGDSILGNNGGLTTPDPSNPLFDPNNFAGLGGSGPGGLDNLAGGYGGDLTVPSGDPNSGG